MLPLMVLAAICAAFAFVTALALIVRAHVPALEPMSPPDIAGSWAQVSDPDRFENAGCAYDMTPALLTAEQN